jgi:hypothetical protein
MSPGCYSYNLLRFVWLYVWGLGQTFKRFAAGLLEYWPCSRQEDWLGNIVQWAPRWYLSPERGALRVRSGPKVRKVFVSERSVRIQKVQCPCPKAHRSWYRTFPGSVAPHTQAWRRKARSLCWPLPRLHGPWRRGTWFPVLSAELTGNTPTGI